MKEERIRRVLDGMAEKGLEQLLVTDPASLFYLTGHYEEPMERFWGLLLRDDGVHRLAANRLFSLPEVEGVEILWHEDGESGVGKLCPYIKKDSPLGIDGSARACFLLELMEREAAAGYRDGSDVMKRVRACKDAEERWKMAEASRINDEAMGYFRELIREGVTELEIAGQMEGIYRRLGADGYSFTPLVGFGANAASGHHSPDRTVLKKGDCVLFDVGCKKDGFCSDMTRTFFFGEPEEESRRVYQTVLQAQTAAEEAVRPGVPLRELDRIARDIITEAGYGLYFTHRLGHFIGYDVHEAGDVSPASDLIAEPGMIFSIEPGIYLPGRVGVRIEDLVLVTEEGAQILNHYPKELICVEPSDEATEVESRIDRDVNENSSGKD
ncbi:MAG: Xaa-Pro peptidase family protein [Roseburia sp.]|nr:Xaa-Pro peptidase family protein [Roseburia sp.]MCM1097654.1 Xaa-Pro peptidase family protein [Ruminococcus flavefaciens]